MSLLKISESYKMTVSDRINQSKIMKLKKNIYIWGNILSSWVSNSGSVPKHNLVSLNSIHP